MGGRRWMGRIEGRRGTSRRPVAGALGLALALVLAAACAPAPALAGEPMKCRASDKECIERVAAKMRTGGWVGVEIDINEETGIYTIERVIPGSPAASSGLRPGDVLLAINGVALSTCKDSTLSETRARSKPGQSVTYTIKRDGHDREITLTLATMPADILARYLAMHIIEQPEKGSPAP